MTTKRTSLAALVLTLCSAWATANAAPSRQASARDGADWLVSQQRSNGAFFSTSERADETAEHLVAVVAGGVRGKPLTKALDHIGEEGKSAAKRGAFTGRIVSGIVAGGGDPSDHNGVDYVKILRAQYDSSTGAHDASQFFDNLLAANGMLATGSKLSNTAVDYIRSNACTGGGFGFDNGCPKGADVDTTSWAINVLVATGRRTDPLVPQSRTWLLGQQHDDGGFAFTKDIAQTSSDSTGLALSAIAALDEDARSAPWRQSDGDDPVKALLALQHSSGGFRFGAGGSPNGSSTRQAVVGMADVAYPVPAAEAQPTPAPTKAPAANAPAERRADAEDDSTARPPARSAVETTTAPSASPSEDKDNATRTPNATEEAAGFEPPVEETPSSPLRSPLLWGAVALIGTGSAFGLRYLRRRGL